MHGTVKTGTAPAHVDASSLERAAEQLGRAKPCLHEHLDQLRHALVALGANTRHVRHVARLCIALVTMGKACWKAELEGHQTCKSMLHQHAAWLLIPGGHTQSALTLLRACTLNHTWPVQCSCACCQLQQGNSDVQARSYPRCLSPTSTAQLRWAPSPAAPPPPCQQWWARQCC